MIHQVSRLPIASSRLADIVALQVAMLELAATVPAVTQQNAEAYLLNKRRFRSRARDIASWVTRKGEKLLAPLNGFAGAEPAQKMAFVENVKRDVLLVYRPRTDTLKLAVLTNAPAWQKKAKDFLSWFYDFWRDEGFDGYLFQPLLPEKYERSQFIREFSDKNPGLYLCAICDGSAYRTETDTKAYASIEHFFPRSIYPHLSCHPYNLIPICSNCNSYIKGDSNPLQLAGNPITLGDLILPYQKEKQGLRDLAYVVTIPRVPRDKSRHPLRIELRPVKGQNLGKRIAAFESLYKVAERWSDDLEQIEEQAFRRMCQFLMLELANGTPLDNSELVRQKMELLMAATDRDNLGRDPYAFALTWLLKGYIDDLKAKRDNSAIFTELKAWAADHGKHWEELKKRAMQIHERVPD